MKILIDEEVAKQALDALGNCCPSVERMDEYRSAKDALCSALDAAEKVEPVAWGLKIHNIIVAVKFYESYIYNIPLYASPTQTEEI